MLVPRSTSPLLSNKVLRRIGMFCLAACSIAPSLSAWGQTAQSRIAGAVTSESRSVLSGSRPLLARAANDMGRVSSSLPLEGMTLVFARSQAQQQDLDALLIAQQDASSPQYHQWLTPEQFGARFGMSDADLAKATAWLQQQGFTVNAVSRSRDRITFSGTAAQAEAAFQTEIHNYLIRGETHFAPSTDISLPSALSAVTTSVTNLTSIRPRPHLRIKTGVVAPNPNFTSSQSGSHFLTPGDIRTIYDINAAYNAGYTGTGQTIAVVGQSAIVNSDIEHFQSAAGLTVKDPTSVLVPNTGVSTVYSDDESESDLDLEYSGAIAPGASITFVFAGSNQNASVLDAETYAIQNNVARIVSISYGECEQSLGATEYASENAVYQQAAAQGQTVVAAAGDDGSSDCVADGISGLYADYPASSQYVTGLGGTEFSSANVALGNTTYWKAASGSDVITSALSYIPEQAWNDSTTGGLSSGGGGTSMFTARPSWQAGVPGIPSGSFRLVPDVSLTASPNNAGYLYCSSDTSVGINGSCANGFRDANNTYLTVAGGTSFAAPIFAGMVALINQSTTPSGQGVVNQKLYALAGNTATYASAFHDITSGNNACVVGYPYCAASASSSYSAATGYDEATGLGSVDLYNMLTAWPSANISTLAASATSVSAATMTPASGATDAITIQVASSSSSSTATPTGTVAITVDGAAVATLPLSGGAATYTFSSGISGTHTVAAAYSGDSAFSSSTGSVTLTIAAGSTVSTTTATAATLTPASGATDAISILIASGSSSSTATPTGVLTITDKYSSSTTTTLPLSNGAATYNFSSNAAGTHILTFIYSGDTTFAGSSASVTLNIPVVIVPSFTLSATNVSLLAGTSFASTVTVTPTNGYHGTVKWTATGPASLTNSCYSIPNTVVQSTTTATMTIYTSQSSCASLTPLYRAPGASANLSAHGEPVGRTSGSRILFAWVLAGGFGLCGLRTRRFRGMLLGVAGVILLGMMSGCGGGGSAGSSTTTSPTSSTNAPAGTYLITLTGTDTVTSTITANTTFTLTVN